MMIVPSGSSLSPRHGCHLVWSGDIDNHRTYNDRS
jgi:hypothetical protein